MLYAREIAEKFLSRLLLLLFIFMLFYLQYMENIQTQRRISNPLNIHDGALTALSLQLYYSENFWEKDPQVHLIIIGE